MRQLPNFPGSFLGASSNNRTQPTSSSALNRILHPYPQPPVPQYGGPAPNSQPEMVLPNPFIQPQYSYSVPSSFAYNQVSANGGPILFDHRGGPISGPFPNSHIQPSQHQSYSINDQQQQQPMQLTSFQSQQQQQQQQQYQYQQQQQEQQQYQQQQYQYQHQQDPIVPVNNHRKRPRSIDEDVGSSSAAAQSSSAFVMPVATSSGTPLRAPVSAYSVYVNPQSADEDEHMHQTHNEEIGSEDEPHHRRPERRKTGEWQKMTDHRERATRILRDPELLLTHAESRQDSVAGTRLHYTRLAAGYAVESHP
ncbi:hypothetical protein Cpir12675_005035 [Ceratocystis pirilliformis]|uniref:Uncharacterized protein n=1 Tax=Ceratocystis pirilliformis TaxID=259994 RepID=A0ABR3YT99_9PEZI